MNRLSTHTAHTIRPFWIGITRIGCNAMHCISTTSLFILRFLIFFFFFLFFISIIALCWCIGVIILFFVVFLIIIIVIVIICCCWLFIGIFVIVGIHCFLLRFLLWFWTIAK